MQHASGIYKLKFVHDDTKMVNMSKNDWDDCLVFTLWTYQITLQGNHRVHAIRISIWHSTIIAYKIGHAYIIKHCP